VGDHPTCKRKNGTNHFVLEIETNVMQSGILVFKTSILPHVIAVKGRTVSGQNVTRDARVLQEASKNKKRASLPSPST
jgi:hypothetical protein